MMLIKLLILMLFFMMSVGFYTLLEQKVLGYMNNRLGPNKILFLGLVQFLMDLLKLMFKENIYMLMFNYLGFVSFILLFFSLSLFMWILVPFLINLLSMKFFFIIIMLILLNKILVFILVIWSLNSIYSILSVIRLIIQNLSFEILFILILFNLIFLFKNLNMIFMCELMSLSMVFMFSFIILGFWMISLLVELNRIPFDFLESESELISGVNLEFSSMNFMILFLVEYLDMIFMSILTVLFFLNLNIMSFMFNLFLIFFMIIFLFIRGFFVRFRIDKLMLILWKFFIPLMLNFFIFFFLIKLFFYIFILLKFKLLKLMLLV